MKHFFCLSDAIHEMNMRLIPDYLDDMLEGLSANTAGIRDKSPREWLEQHPEIVAACMNAWAIQSAAMITASVAGRDFTWMNDWIVSEGFGEAIPPWNS